MRLNRDVEVDDLLGQAKYLNIPLTLIDLADEHNVPEAYQHALVLCRTDQHVVWRGNTLAESLQKLLHLMRGL